MNAVLPPLPSVIRTLSDEESRALDARYPRRDLVHCVTCRGKKTFRWYGYDNATSRMGDIVTYDCPCADQWILNRYLLHCGIGLLYQRYDWDDYQIKIPPEMVQWMTDAEAYVAAGFGFVLTGNLGNGKTMLSLLALKTLIGQGFDGYFTTFTELITAHTSTWRSREDREWFTRRVRNADVLVIDDLGRETNQKGRTRTAEEVAAGDKEVEKGGGTPEFMKAAFEEIVRHRVAQALPTIITTNVKMDVLGMKYSTNVFSLLQERSKTIEFTGADYRQTANARNDAEIAAGLTRPVVLA